MARFFCLFFLLLTSCLETTDAEKTTSGDTLKSHVWVCHNPNSQQHGHPCEIEHTDAGQKYETCYETGGAQTSVNSQGSSTFCWLLERGDCENVELEWQKEYCHLLGD